MIYCKTLLVLAAIRSAALAGSDPDQFPVNVLMNSGFELVADSTTEPPKYGAFWRDAFVHEKGNPKDSIVEYAPGKHGLLIARDAGSSSAPKPVSQLATLYGPGAERFEISLRVRYTDLDGLLVEGQQGCGEGAQGLVLGVTTQGDRKVFYRFGGDPDDNLEDERMVVALDGEVDGDGFHRVRIAVGADLERLTGAAPQPWNRITLTNYGRPVLVDDLVGVHYLPRIQPRELREALLDDVRDMIRVFLGKPGQTLEGLDLVDRHTGYQSAGLHNVVTGEVSGRFLIGQKNGIHDIILRYLSVADDDPKHQVLRLLARRILRTHLGSFLENNVYAPTGLYCSYDAAKKEPKLDTPTVPFDFIQYVLTATELPYPEFRYFRDDAIAKCIRMADKLVELRDMHDLEKGAPFYRGPRGNWFGRLPEKFFPEGAMDVPLKNKGVYDQAWAIKSNRSWYHDFDSAEGIARTYGVHAKPAYAECISKLIALYDREFDAERYDMENDTDDHYGVNVEALLRGFRTGGYKLTEMRDFAQAMTDYRLSRDHAWDDNLWVQGIRLGSFTTGDQPRAFRGPVWLSTIPKEHNPATSGYLGYERAVREMTKSDLKRRLLDDGYMTEASSYQWEMMSACYVSDYIGPCSEARKWEGDMGDQFAGPATNGFRALGRALEIGRRGVNKEFLSWYYLVHRHTEDLYRRPYGYLFGMPKETGRRYKIPERYLEGFSETSIYQMAPTAIHVETLNNVDLDYEEATVGIGAVARGDGGLVRVELRGPAGRSVEVCLSDATEFSEVGVTDWRLRFTPPDAPTQAVVLDAEGHGVATFADVAAGRVAVDAILRLPGAEDVDDIASGEYGL